MARKNQVSKAFINRELSLLDFNYRVLEQAKDKNIPLLERLRYLCILSSNLDEFFEIRVSSLKQRSRAAFANVGPDGSPPQEVLSQISKLAHSIVDEQYKCLETEILPKLSQEGIDVLTPEEWTPKLKAWALRYFKKEVLPILSPMGLDPSHPFPKIINKSLNFIVSLTGKDAFGRNVNVAVVPVPRSIPRFIPLPKWYRRSKKGYIALATLVSLNVDQLFFGLKVKGCYQFRVTRNSNLFVDEEEVDDLLVALEGELSRRQHGAAVRLEIEQSCPKELVGFLSEHFDLVDEDVFYVNGPVNLHRMMSLIDSVDIPSLKFAPFTPSVSEKLSGGKDAFEAIRRKDILIHHPYESFAPVVDLIRQAAVDPNVLVIRQSLYRTGLGSVMADYLIQAAEAGKEVTVVIELRARFDEEANISIANRLQEAGVHVVYGIVGYKTHCKMLMIARREGRGIRHYIHMGTGNYNTNTTRLYTDYGFLSANQILGKELHKIFLQLMGSQKAFRLKRLLHSPFTLFNSLRKKINREIRFARAGEKAQIRASINGLDDPQLVKLLYKASKAGVKIDLIVRGICILRPGVPGQSENISVISVVGRFLEHTRVYYFRNGGDEDVYLSSADWMTRNLFKRVELAFPIEDPTMKARVIKESFTTYLSDNVNAWELLPNGKYKAVARGELKRHCAQEELIKDLALAYGDS